MKKINVLERLAARLAKLGYNITYLPIHGAKAIVILTRDRNNIDTSPLTRYYEYIKKEDGSEQLSKLPKTNNDS